MGITYVQDHYCDLNKSVEDIPAGETFKGTVDGKHGLYLKSSDGGIVSLNRETGGVVYCVQHVLNYEGVDINISIFY